MKNVETREKVECHKRRKEGDRPSDQNHPLRGDMKESKKKIAKCFKALSEK